MPGSSVNAVAVRYGTPVGRGVLLATVLGSGMAMLDSTVVNVALPTIGRELNVSLALLQWTVNAYTLTLAGLILLGGALGDRFGRRRVFLTGVVWFAASSLLCGVAPNAYVLVGARALQGVGGALLTPGSLAIIQASFHPDDRARAVGAWSGLGGVATAVGPLLGGWLVDAAGWRWVFFINLPVAAAAVYVTVRWVPETLDPAARDARFDLPGAVLAAVALAGVTWALVAAVDTPGAAVVAGVVGLAAAAAFGYTERRSPHPMMPLGLFRNRLFSAVNALTLCVYAALGAVMLLLVLDLQESSGWSAQSAGLALLPVTVLMLLLSSRSGDLARRVGPRLPLTLGPVLCAAGLLLLLRTGPHVFYPTDVLPGVVVLGLGMALTVAPLTATVLAAVDVERAGIASGVNNAAARAAGLLAVAGLPVAVGLSGDAYRDAAAVNSGFHAAMWVCAALMLVGAVIAWWWVPAGALGPGPEADRCTQAARRPSCAVGAPPLQEPVPAPAAAASDGGVGGSAGRSGGA